MIERYYDELCTRIPALQCVRRDFLAAYELCTQTFRNGGTMYICGNGGSMADAEHIAGELMKGFLRSRPLSPPEQKALKDHCSVTGLTLAKGLQRGLPTVVLGGMSSLTSAVANDVGADLVYAQHLYVLCRPGDVLLALSTSGNARNVLMAQTVAAAKGVCTIALTGRNGGKLGSVADICVRAPADATHLVQEMHLPLYHCLCAMLEETFFGE